jgi:hypothetical protein
MPGVNIKKDDTVRVMTGKDRGKQGRVIHVLPREGRIMVDGVGRAKKATRATGGRGKKGQQLSQGAVHRHLERAARLPELWGAHSDRVPDRRRRQVQGLSQVRGRLPEGGEGLRWPTPTTHLG